MWKVELSPSAARDLHSLESGIAARIVKKLEEAAVNPARFFERMAGYDYFKMRVGDYRVIALLLHKKETVYVQRIGHRKNIYDKIR